MSKGIKQKIGLVTAFMGNLQVLILDEPTSGLDPLMQNRFVELVLEEKKRETTILMSSHIFNEVERTCDRTAIIRQGRIVDTVSCAAWNQCSSIRGRVHHFHKKRFIIIENINKLNSLSFFSIIHKKGQMIQ